MLEKESNVRMADKTLRKVIWCNLVNILCYPISIPIYLKEFNTHQINRRLSEDISPGCSLEGLMLKLELQYFGHLMRRVDSLEKTLMLGGIGGRRRRGRQRMRWLDGITDSMVVSVNSGSWCWTGRPGVLRFTGSQRAGHDWATDLIWIQLSHKKEKFFCHFQQYGWTWRRGLC